jgi:hypothetical protein
VHPAAALGARLKKFEPVASGVKTPEEMKRLRRG